MTHGCCSLSLLFVWGLRASERFEADQVTATLGRDAAWRANQIETLHMFYTQPALFDTVDDTGVGNVLWLHAVATADERRVLEDWVGRLVAHVVFRV